jgi:hypothetical protein
MYPSKPEDATGITTVYNWINGQEGKARTFYNF